MDQQKIGEFLKLLRKESGLTQEQLAESMNVSARTVSRWETGSNLPELDMLIRLAERYEVSVGEILDGERMVRGKLDEFSEVSIEGDSVELLTVAQEALVKAADYSKINEKQLLTKLITIMGMGMAVLFFGSGRYHNYGIQGAYYAFLVVGSVFVITGLVTRWITTKQNLRDCLGKKGVF